MKKFAFVLLVLSISVTAAKASCSLESSRPWAGFKIEAVASGPDCAKAVVTLIIRNSSGGALWSHSYVASELMSFSQSPNADDKAMLGLLKDWISGEGFMKSADKLVMDGEFAFDLGEGTDAATFAKFRKSKLPLFCYIQGMESGNCLAKSQDGSLIELGLQRFPG